MKSKTVNCDKRNGRESQANKEKYRLLVENAREAMYVVRDGVIVFANPSCARMAGMDISKIVGAPIERFVPRDDLGRARDRHEKIIKGEKDANPFESKMVGGPGRESWVSVNTVPIPWNGREATLNIASDITARKRAEEKLKASELRFKSLLENAFEGISVVCADGTVMYESPGLERNLGYKPHEMANASAFDNVHPGDLPVVREAFGNALKQPDKIIKIEVRIKHKDGSLHWIECAGKNLLQDPAIKGIVVNYRDVTERKKAEEERLRVEQRMQQSQKLESLGLLAGGIAHDFNNLMAGIFGYIDLALALSQDGKISKYLSIAMGAIDRARSLTGQLLTFARGGTPVLEKGGLLPVIRDAANFACSGSNISVAFDVAENLMACSFDRNQISQVIGNMVINAQQAMPRGGTIAISARNLFLSANETGPLQPGNYVRISIADTGTGIPEDHLPKIFDPFFSTKKEGSGLGLSICHSIVKRHNGWISVESAAGKGTKFNIYLPASGEAAAPEGPSVPSGPLHRGSGRMLVMDDEETIRKSLAHMLGLFGYTVECRPGGNEVLAFLEEDMKAGRSLAGIILDLTIPGGMGGKEAAARIKKMNGGIPIFVVSGYSNDPVMANPQKYGFRGSICKPFNINELSDMLNRHLPSCT